MKNFLRNPPFRRDCAHVLTRFFCMLRFCVTLFLPFEFYTENSLFVHIICIFYGISQFPCEKQRLCDRLPLSSTTTDWSRLFSTNVITLRRRRWTAQFGMNNLVCSFGCRFLVDCWWALNSLSVGFLSLISQNSQASA